MDRHVRTPRGFTLNELMVTLGTIAVLSGISIPLLTGAMQRAQATGAADALAGAIRDARARAIATGWQYQVVAFDASGAVPNAFRIQGAVVPPAGPVVFPAVTSVTPPVSYGSSQMYEAYTDLAREFGGAQIQIPAGGGTFTVTFDSRGQWATPCVPVGCQVRTTGSGGTPVTLTVSQAGAVQITR